MPDGSRRFRVVFHSVSWDQDLARSTPAGREAGREARAALERSGAPYDQLRRCHNDARDGTQLAGCFKLYVPPPVGPWGVVFIPGRDTTGLHLTPIAFGMRHPPSGRRESVYQLAHRRLHGT